MSYYNNDDRIKLSVKSSNYEIVSKFASTEKDVQLLLLANNSNLYNWNNINTGGIFGAELVNIGLSNEHHEPYIATQYNGKKN